MFLQELTLERANDKLDIVPVLAKPGPGMWAVWGQLLVTRGFAAGNDSYSSTVASLVAYLGVWCLY